MAKVSIDESACVGCGLCANSCPDVFELSSEGVARAKRNQCDSCDLHEIASQCPVNCITVED